MFQSHSTFALPSDCVRVYALVPSDGAIPWISRDFEVIRAKLAGIQSAGATLITLDQFNAIGSVETVEGSEVFILYSDDEDYYIAEFHVQQSSLKRATFLWSTGPSSECDFLVQMSEQQFWMEVLDYMRECMKESFEPGDKIDVCKIPLDHENSDALMRVQIVNSMNEPLDDLITATLIAVDLSSRL